MKDGTYIINLDEYESIGIHWIASYVNGDQSIEILKILGLITNIEEYQKYNHDWRKHLD